VDLRYSLNAKVEDKMQFIHDKSVRSALSVLLLSSLVFPSDCHAIDNDWKTSLQKLFSSGSNGAPVVSSTTSISLSSKTGKRSGAASSRKATSTSTSGTGKAAITKAGTGIDASTPTSFPDLTELQSNITYFDGRVELFKSIEKNPRAPYGWNDPAAYELERSMESYYDHALVGHDLRARRWRPFQYTIDDGNRFMGEPIILEITKDLQRSKDQRSSKTDSKEVKDKADALVSDATDVIKNASFVHSITKTAFDSTVFQHLGDLKKAIADAHKKDVDSLLTLKYALERVSLQLGWTETHSLIDDDELVASLTQNATDLSQVTWPEKNEQIDRHKAEEFVTNATDLCDRLSALKARLEARVEHADSQLSKLEVQTTALRDAAFNLDPASSTLDKAQAALIASVLSQLDEAITKFKEALVWDEKAMSVNSDESQAFEDKLTKLEGQVSTLKTEIESLTKEKPPLKQFLLVLRLNVAPTRVPLMGPTHYSYARFNIKIAGKRPLQPPCYLWNSSNIKWPLGPVPIHTPPLHLLQIVKDNIASDDPSNNAFLKIGQLSARLKKLKQELHPAKSADAELCAAKILEIFPISSYLTLNRTDRNEINVTIQPSWNGFSAGQASDDFTRTDAMKLDLPRIVGTASRFGDCSWTLYPQKSQPLMLGMQTVFVQFALPTDCAELVIGGEYDYQFKRFGVLSGPIYKRFDVLKSSLCKLDKVDVANLALNIEDDVFQKVSKSADNKMSKSPSVNTLSNQGKVDYVNVGGKLFGVSKSEDQILMKDISDDDSKQTD
jgi:hypothetical protein